MNSEPSSSVRSSHAREKQHTRTHTNIKIWNRIRHDPLAEIQTSFFFPILFPHRKTKRQISLARSDVQVEVEQNREMTEDLLTSAAFSPPVIIPPPSSRFPATSHLMQNPPALLCSVQHPPSACPVLSPIHNFSAPSCCLWMSLKDKERSLRALNFFPQRPSQKPASCFYLSPLNAWLWGNVTSLPYTVYSAALHYGLENSQPNQVPLRDRRSQLLRAGYLLNK